MTQLNVAENYNEENNQEVEDNQDTQTIDTIDTGKVDGTGKQITFGKRKNLHKAIVDNADGSFNLELYYKNGESKIITVPQSRFLDFAKHGASQRFGDTYNAATTDGNIEDAIEAVDLMAIQIIDNGQWVKESEGKGESKGVGLLVLALSEHLGVDKSKVQVFIAPKTVAEKRAMMEVPELKTIIDRIKAERAAKNPKKENAIDTDILFAAIKAL